MDNCGTYCILLQNITFVKYYDNLVRTYNNKDEIKQQFFNDIKNSIMTKMRNNRSKYITYLQINPNLKIPDIYENIINNHQRNLTAKLRLVSHDLMIEVGRRTNILIENRRCLCGEIETEEHILLYCIYYANIRNNHSIIIQSIETILSNKQYSNYITEITTYRKTLREQSNQQF